MNDLVHFICNNEEYELIVNGSEAVIDFLRKKLKLTGTKAGCREGDCGACTVLVGNIANGKLAYKAVNSCLLPLRSINGKHLVTIEGLNRDELSPVQQFILEEGASQCGFCTPGFIMSLTCYFVSTPLPKYANALDAIAGNICRCTGYESIKRAVKKMCADINESCPNSDSISYTEILIKKNYIPEYFLGMENRLEKINKTLEKDIPSGLKALLIAGGTDVYVQRQNEMPDIEIEDALQCGAVSEIKLQDGFIAIGAAATISQVAESEVIKNTFPAFKNDLKYFGSQQIRNRGTVGGNIKNASPIGDFANILLAMNAEIILKQGNKRRKTLLKDLYISYKTLDMRSEEIIEAVKIKIPPEGFVFNYEKISRRKYLDIASVNSSFFAEKREGKFGSVRVSAGGVAPYPLYLARTSEMLSYSEITPELLANAVKTALTEINPISDARGSYEYKGLLLRQLMLSHFIKFFPEHVQIEDYIC